MITLKDLNDLILNNCSKFKGEKYSECEDINLLIYLNRKVQLDPSEMHLPDPEECFLRWRSVSVIMERHAVVLFSGDGAPDYLQRTDKIITWEKPESVFPRLGE